MTTYTTTEGQSFDAEILRQELVAAIGADGWCINTAGNTVTFVPPQSTPTELNPLVEATILAHFAADPATREANKAILKQIADLEATQTPRRIREGGQWMIDLEVSIAALRAQLK